MYKTYRTGFSFRRLCYALGWDLGVLKGQKSNNPRRVSDMLSPHKPLDEISNLVWELLTWMGRATANICWPIPLGPWGRVKYHFISINIISFKLQSQFQRFLYKTLCVFSKMKDSKHIRRDFYSVTWVMPRCGTLGRWGCPEGHFLLNMVMWHIKLMGMTSKTGCK